MYQYPYLSFCSLQSKFFKNFPLLQANYSTEFWISSHPLLTLYKHLSLDFRFHLLKKKHSSSTPYSPLYLLTLSTFSNFLKIVNTQYLFAQVHSFLTLSPAHSHHLPLSGQHPLSFSDKFSILILMS